MPLNCVGAIFQRWFTLFANDFELNPRLCGDSIHAKAVKGAQN